MTRQFSIPTVLRMVPNGLLEACFLELGHGEFDPHWGDLKKREIDPLLDYLGELPLDQLNAIESVFRSVFELGCPTGFDALIEAGPHCGVSDLAALVPGGLCPYGLSMWAWLNHRNVFEKAQIIYQVEQLSWWRKRNDLPQVDPDQSPEAREQLETAISSLLKSQGRGKDCTVETFTRGNVDHYFAYPDDFVQNVMVHDGGKLAPEAFRQTMLIVFAYDRTEGTLETFAKLPKPMKERLEGIFAAAILHWELGTHEPDAAYELNQLKDVTFKLKTDAEDRVRVRIHKKRLSAKHSGRRVHVEIDDEDPDDNIHKAIAECINLDEMPLSEWNVTQVTFCFEFLPHGDRKPGQQSFDVTFPRSCSLRNARPERVELIQKYLKRWKIDRVGTTAPSPVTVGD